MLRPLTVLALAVAFGWTACESKDPIVLELSGEAVRRSDFQRHVDALEARGLGPLSAEVRRGLLESFLEQRALVIEARGRGLLEKGATAERERSAVARLLAAAVPTPEISDESIAAWHASHAAELTIPERVTLRQILVGSLNEARDVKRRLARNPRSFDTLARRISKAPEASRGGQMGSFERGQLPAELDEVAFSLPEGGTSNPVSSPLGYHVLRVESRQAAREIPLEEAREWIRDRLAREARDAAERAFVAEVMARAKVNHEAAFAPVRTP